MSRARTMTLAVLGFCGAYAIGRWTIDAPAPTTRVVEHDRERTIVKHAGSTTIDLDGIRAIVRDELANARASDSSAPRSEDKPPIDDAQLAVATTALDQGMTDGRWTTEDRDRLRAVLPTLSQAEFEAVASRLFPALNSGKLQLAIEGGAPL